MSSWSITPWIVLIVVSACGDHVRPLDILVQFEVSTDPPRVASMTLEVFADSCAAPPIATTTVRRGEPLSMQPGLLGPGTYFLSVVALARDCTVIAESRCLPLELPYDSGTLTVSLLHLDTPVDGCDGRCMEGLCIDTDGGCAAMELVCNGIDDDCDNVTSDEVTPGSVGETAEFCGSCDTTCFFDGGAGEPAIRPTCASGTCLYACVDPSLEFCAGRGCRSFETTDDCGACGTVCGNPALPRCADDDGDGTFACTACAPPETGCKSLTTGRGVCVDLETDVRSCGTCNHNCNDDVENVEMATCAAGACGYTTCTSGFDNCDGSPANGCETNLLADRDHCSACGSACALPMHAMDINCVDGLCIPRCVAPYRMCTPTSTQCTQICPT